LVGMIRGILFESFEDDGGGTFIWVNDDGAEEWLLDFWILDCDLVLGRGVGSGIRITKGFKIERL
jgi:hypothetical protein